MLSGVFMGNASKQDFMNIVEDFGVKIGWYIQCPKEYMKIYEYKRKSFFDLSLRSFIFRQHLLKSHMANCDQIS